MSNSFYNATGTPTTSSLAASANVRAEFSSIGAAFDKMPSLTGNALLPLIVNGTGQAVTLYGMNLDQIAQFYDPAYVTTYTGLPTGAKRYNSANGLLEQWSGSAWAATPTGYLTLSGGTMTGAITSPNATYQFWKDTGAVARRVLGLSGANFNVGDVDNTQAGGNLSLYANNSINGIINGSTLFQANSTGISFGGSPIAQFTARGGNSEVFRGLSDTAFLSGYNSTGATRTGYLQFNATSSFVKLHAESGFNLIFAANGTNQLTFTGTTAAMAVPLTVTGVAGSPQITATDGNVTALSGYCYGAGATAVAGLGSLSSHDVTLITGNVERVRILKTTGYVGIGKTPTVPLDVNGAAAVSSLVVAGSTTGTGGFIGNLTGNVTGTCTGNAGSATKLQTARTINGVAFDGTADITLSNSGNAATATALQTARLINGVSFDGTADINITTITGNAATATKLATARTINGVSFDGTANIAITTANGGTIWSSGNLTGVSGLTNDAGYITGTGSTTGNAGTATKLATARTINGVSFDGTANINIVPSTVASGATDGTYELGYKDIPVVGSQTRGCAAAISAGVTINTDTAGRVYSFYNDSAAAITLTAGASLTLRLAGTSTVGNRTLSARGFCTVWFRSSTEAICSGNVA